MSRPRPPAAQAADEETAAGSGVGRIEIAEAELERARVAYCGSLQSSRAWRAFSPITRHHDTTYWTLLSLLFADPGMNRTVLVDRIIDYAGVSRSTAERAVREGREHGYIVDQPQGREVRYFLSDITFNHCVSFFRSYMDLEKVIKNFGYDKE